MRSSELALSQPRTSDLQSRSLCFCGYDISLPDYATIDISQNITKLFLTPPLQLDDRHLKLSSHPGKDHW